LPGKGEPINLRENPFEDPDRRTVHRLLRNAGFAPAWIEERKDIDAEFEAARTKLSRAWTLFGKSGKLPSDKQWERSVREGENRGIKPANQNLQLEGASHGISSQAYRS